jgi:hypothetical protein
VEGRRLTAWATARPVLRVTLFDFWQEVHPWTHIACRKQTHPFGQTTNQCFRSHLMIIGQMHAKLNVLIKGVLLQTLHGPKAFYIPTDVINRSDINRRHFHDSLLAFRLCAVRSVMLDTWGFNLNPNATHLVLTSLRPSGAMYCSAIMA